MPLINYSCSCGENLKKYLKSAKDALPTVKCSKCGLEAKKSFGATSSSHKTIIDDGHMARRLEIDPSIMEINDERSAKDYTEED
jgi:uncharacterized Zn finger protein